MDKEDNLAEQVIESINNWFEQYDWDEAFEKLLRKYEGL